ncbi:O-antigen ligase [Paracoccus sp. SCSIO 75233]|uniref:O-antigen ligase family protein n=1 Tax=Paracoccus sp. SCSIO 75233 TaxID=3017782 RepID=UPI0022F14229|nr:O-antigen ligase family protein [Paracoccus sp. SCSIO 75233]WBU52619.1 O-antigen ligase family protein [Paracoccus sp. SCSIO 75233]
MSQADILAEEIPALPAGAGKITWRADLFLAVVTVFLSPINYLRPDFVYVTLSDVFAVATLLVMFVQGRLPLHPFGRAATCWYLSVFLLAFGLLIGSAFNGDIVSGITVTVQYCFSLLIMPALFLRRERAEVMLLLKIYVLSMVVVMIHGAYVVEFTPDDFRFVTPNGRLASLVERENGAATLTAVAIMFNFWLFLTREIRFVLFLAFLAPLGWGLLLTGSNTGFFLTGLGFVSLALFSRDLRLIAGVIVGGAGFLMILYNWGEFFLPEIFMKRVFGALESGDLGQAGTFSDRLFLIREALGITKHTLFLGLGADQYRTISAHEAPVHSTYLLLFAEGGFVSLLGHFGLMLSGILVAWPVWFSRETRMYGALTFTTIIMFALVQNGLPHVYARFWVVPWFLALAASLSPEAEAGSGDVN